MTEICRVCMKSDFFMSSIFSQHSNLKIIVRKICPYLKFKLDDGLPEGFCSDCEQRFRDAYDLVKLAESSDKTLRKQQEEDAKAGLLRESDLKEVATKDEVEIKIESPSEGQTVEDVTVKVEPEIQNNESSSDDDNVALSSFVGNDEDDGIKSDSSGSNYSNSLEIQKERKKTLKKSFRKEEEPKRKKDPKPKKAICPICGKTVSRIATHLKVHQDTTVQCDICKKFLAAKASLASHMKLVHMKKRIKCNHCDQLFWNTTTLRVHEQKVHVDSTEQHKCNLCEKIFGHAETLVNHIKYHEYMQRKNGGKQIYFKNSMQCNACDFIYYARPQFEAHINLHNNRFECKFCQEVFSQNYSVAVHRRYNHRNTFKQLIRMYFCDMCEFSTKSGFNLKRHRAWHQKKQ